LGSIVIELLANTASFVSGMSKASYEGKRAAKEIHQSFHEMGDKIGGAAQNAMASLGQFGAVAGELSRGLVEAFDGLGKGSNGVALAVTALGGLAAAGIAAAAGLVELGKSGAELVEHLQHVSEKTGIGVRSLQIFEAAGATVGVSLDDMVIGMKRFDQALLNTGKGTAAQGILKELGVTARDNKEAFLQTAEAFAAMEDGPRKASDAVALFGKSGLNLIPLLNKGRDGILEWEAAVDKFGPKIGKEAVHANEEYRKSVENMSLQWDKFKVDAETNVLPILTKLTKWFNDNGGFSAALAGMAGGRGAAAILQAQQKANEAATNAAKQESSAKDESRRKQEQLNNSLKENFEVMKLGGSAAYSLSQARLELEGAVQNGLWKEASAIQSQLPGLEKAAALEAQRVARAKQLADSYASMQKFFDSGAIVKPLLKIAPTDSTKGIEALFGPQPKKDALAGAPDLEPDFLKDAPDLMKQTFGTGLQEVRDFEAQWKATSASINADYGKQLEHWKDLLNKQAISQQQFNDISRKLETDRLEGLKQLRQDTGTSTFRDAWSDMFRQIEASGKDFARSITADIGFAIESLNMQLQQFVATGKGLSLKSVGQSLEANLFGSILRKGESSLFGSVGKMLGLDLGGKRDGSSASNALYVQMAGSGAFGSSGLDNLPLGNLGGIINALGFGGGAKGGGILSGGSSLFSKIGGGIGSILSSIGGFFGGFFEGGGDVMPGRAYVVGEKRPELFVPRSAGSIVPSVSNGVTKNIHVQNVLQVHGATDADSFRKSSAQIFNAMSRGQQHAMSRA
jgi:hypothetical protein